MMIFKTYLVSGNNRYCLFLLLIDKWHIKVIRGLCGMQLWMLSALLRGKKSLDNFLWIRLD